MTREEHLQFCRYCKKQSFHFDKGIICSLTKDIADFEGTCPSSDPTDTALVDLQKDAAVRFIENDKKQRKLELILDSGWSKYQPPRAFRRK